MLFFKRIVGVLLSAIILIAAFFFSVVILAIVATGVVIVAGYLWWKTRALRRAVKAGDSLHPEHAAYSGRTIEATEVYEVRTEVIEDQTKQAQPTHDETKRPPQ